MISGRRRRGDGGDAGDEAVSDVVGSILLVAIAIVLASSFTFFLLTQA